MSKTTITYKDVAPGADRTADFSGAQYEDFSQLTELRNEHPQQNIATLERNLWVLDGSFDGFGEEGQVFPFWSDVLSDENGILDPQPSITVEFPAQYSTTAITMQFDEVPGARASEINVKWYRGSVIVTDADFYPTAPLYSCIQRAELFDKVVITFRKTPLPCRRVKLRQIIFGVIRKFGMDEIRSARVTNQTGLASVELPVSTLDWTLDSKEDIDFMFQFKQPVEVKNDNYIIGVYYIAETSRTSKSVYSLHCQDALGVLDNDIIPGGFYSNYSAKQLLTEIIGEDFEIDFGDAEDKPLTGLLEPMTKRLAIQNVLFGWGACIATDGGEALRVFGTGSIPEYIGLDRCYTGVSVETSSIVTALTLTAHDYKEDPNGSIEVNGKKYSDTPTEYTITNGDVTINTKANIIEVDGAAFVNSSNVKEAAQRVYNYYMQRNTANVKIVWRGELTGDSVEVPDAWGGTHAGNIEQMDITISNKVAAELRVITP